MSSKVTSVIRGAACCGPRGRRAKRSGRCNARGPGNSCTTRRQRPSYRRPYGRLHPKIWRRSGNVLQRIASVSAYSAVPGNRPKRSSSTCVSSGPCYRLQAQGDFCGIARNRLSLREWMPMLPWPVWPLAGHARRGQNVVAGSMPVLLAWR